MGESYSGGTLANLRLTNAYDAYFRGTSQAAISTSTFREAWGAVWKTPMTG